jgi:hypothetical protein
MNSPNDDKNEHEPSYFINEMENDYNISDDFPSPLQLSTVN